MFRASLAQRLRALHCTKNLRLTFSSPECSTTAEHFLQFREVREVIARPGGQGAAALSTKISLLFEMKTIPSCCVMRLYNKHF